MPEFSDVVQLLAAGGVAKTIVDILRKAAPTLPAWAVLALAFALSLGLNLGAEYVQLGPAMDSVAIVRSLVLGTVSFGAAVAQTEIQSSVAHERADPAARNSLGQFVGRPKVKR